MHPSPSRSSQRAPSRRPACPSCVVLIAALASFNLPGPVAATPFATWQDLTGVANSDACWGDIDSDGDLDLVLCGLSNSGRITRTYRNDSGTLSLLQDLTGIENEGSGCLAWGDYDGDGDLDLAMAGASDGGNIARIYANDGTGHLTWDASQVLTGVTYASLAWGDYDGDGDLDLLVMGHTGTAASTCLYENEPRGTLVAASMSLTALYAGSADWADWDGDGDVDLLLTGSDGSASQVLFYKNTPTGTLVADGSHGLTGVSLADAAWGDFDNDGDFDLACTGSTGTGRIAHIYKNNGTGTLTLFGAFGSSVYRSSVAWGDADSDGDLDLAWCGYDGLMLHGLVSVNTGTAFSPTMGLSLQVREGSMSWADADGDGDLDLLTTGADWDYKYARLSWNEQPPNTAPTLPALCSGAPAGGMAVRFTWSGATDGQTPGAGLYYILRVGTSPGAHDVVSGTYSTPLLGNVGQATAFTVHASGSRPYYWSVATLDAGFMPSATSAEMTSYGISPWITSVTDVPGDQGRQVRLRWLRSTYDAAGDSVEITGYSVWRRIDAGHKSHAVAGGALPAPQAAGPPRLAYPPGDWEYVTTVPARGESQYGCIAPTLCDSTSAGLCGSTYFVSAMTPSPLVYYDSPAASGYSVDNLAPAPPAGLAAAVEGADIQLTWTENEETDLGYYAVYRGTTADFTPGTPIGYATAPAFADDTLPPPDEYWYKITALDWAGNESAPSMPAGVATAVPPNDETQATALSLVIEAAGAGPVRLVYSIPGGAAAKQVRLAVYDTRGRLVRLLADEPRAGGVYTVSWDGTTTSGRAASGVYFCQLGWEGQTCTQRLITVR